jgi:hypothetical protein
MLYTYAKPGPKIEIPDKRLVFSKKGAAMSHNARKATLAFLALCPLLLAEQATHSTTQELNNDSVIKLIKAGLSEDLIVSTINALPGSYDTSADGLIALKTAGASDKVISAIVVRTLPAAPGAKALVAPTPPVAETAVSGRPTQSPVAAAAQESAQASFAAAQTQPNGSLVAAEAPHNTASVPRVFLQSASKGTNRNAARDQSMEMSKDMEKDCPGVQVTINQQMADYTVLLNHIEVGLVRDNQIQVANKDGDLISKTKEGGSIAAGMKKACALMLADWAKR